MSDRQSTIQQTSLWTVIRTGFPAFLLFLIPLAILFLGYERLLAKALEAERKTEQMRISHYLCEDGEAGDPLGRIYSLVAGLYWQAMKRPEPLQALGRSLRRLKRQYPNVFECAVFARNDQLVREMSDLPEYHDLLGDAAGVLGELTQGNTERFQKERRRFIPLFGPFFSPMPKPLGGLRYRRSLSAKRGWFFLIPFFQGDRPWMLVWVSVPRALEEFCLRLQLRLSPPPVPGTRFTIVNVTQLGKQSEEVREAILALGGEPGQVIARNGFFWRQLLPKGNKRILIRAPDFPLRRYHARIGAFLHVIGMLGGLVLILARPLIGWIQGLSLRRKILFLFFYSAAIPLLLLALAAQGLSLERIRVAERRLADRQARVLREAARKPFEELARLEELGHRYLAPPLRHDSEGLRRFQAFSEVMTKTFDVSMVSLCDDKGQMLSRAAAPGYHGVMGQIAALMGPYLSQRIALANQEQQTAEQTAKEQAIMASLESMGVEVSQFVDYVHPLDTIKLTLFGSTSTFLLAHRLVDPNNRVRFLCISAWGMQFLRNACYRSLRKFQSRVPDMPVFSAVDFPEQLASGAIAPILFRIQRQIEATHQVKKESLKVEGSPWMVSGIPGTVEFPLPILAVASTTHLQTEAETIRQRLGLIACCLIAIALGIGVLTGRTFLRPVEDLSRGMAEVKARNFHFRLPVHGANELAQLTASFNRMVDGMEDLEIGRIIQETFFPQCPLESPDWEIFGRSQSASRVGGDYFDYFPLPDGRWLLIIGDVSGHGVAAALVVAMAKALSTRAGNPSQPGQILEILNGPIARTLKRKKMMSCLAAVFNPATGEMTMANAGHNFPILMHESRPAYVKIKGVLLGIKPGVTYAEQSLTLGPGDWLCLYTDGLVEAIVQGVDQIGYERLEAALPSLIRPTAPATEMAIRHWFEELSGHRSLEDDVTVVILQSKAGTPRENAT